MDVNAILSFKELRVQKLRCRGDRRECRYVIWSIDLIDKYSFFALGEEACVCLYRMLRRGKGWEWGITSCKDGISALIKPLTFQVATWREITHYTRTAVTLMHLLSTHFSRPVSVKSSS